MLQSPFPVTFALFSLSLLLLLDQILAEDILLNSIYFKNMSSAINFRLSIVSECWSTGGIISLLDEISNVHQGTARHCVAS